MLRTIDLYEQLSYFEGSEDFASELNALYQQLEKVKKNLDQQVVGLVNNLQAQIMSDKLPSKRGFFTRVHNWWKNLFGGDQLRSNPYYWQNKIGALGRSDIEPPTVREYAMLKTLSDTLWEATESAPQPMIKKILTTWGNRLRQTISNSLDDMLKRVRDMSTTVASNATREEPAEVPAKEPRPKFDVEVEPVEKIHAAVKKYRELLKTKDRDEAWDALSDEERELLKDMRKRKPTPFDDDFEPVSAADDEDPGDPPDSESGPEAEEEDLDTQAKKYGILKDTQTTFGVFGRLDDGMKRVVIQACKEGACPTREKPEDKYPIREIHATTEKYLSLFKKTNNRQKTWEALTAREQEILKKIHEPWNKLKQTTRSLHNKRGNNGKKIRDRSQTGPFTLPKVVRIDDPRHEILKKFYPDLFSHLDLGGRVERPDDTEAAVVERIKRLLMKDEEEGKRVEKDDEVKPAASGPAAVADMPDEKSKEGGKKKIDYSDVKMVDTHDEDDDLDEDPSVAAIESRLFDSKYEDFAPKLKSLAKTNRSLVTKILDIWDSIDSKTVKKKFIKLVEGGRFTEILAMGGDKKKKGKDDDDDEEVKKHFGESKAPNITEAFKTNLDSMKRGLRLLSQRAYQES